jgi:hypothetical protein
VSSIKIVHLINFVYDQICLGLFLFISGFHNAGTCTDVMIMNLPDSSVQFLAAMLFDFV